MTCTYISSSIWETFFNYIADLGLVFMVSALNAFSLWTAKQKRTLHGSGKERQLGLTKKEKLSPGRKKSVFHPRKSDGPIGYQKIADLLHGGIWTIAVLFIISEAMFVMNEVRTT